MKIKKLGHCCFIAQIDGKRIMTDPGAFSTLQNDEKNIDLVVISHEHHDHLHMDSLKEILKNNPNTQIISNTAVGLLLDKEGISYTKIEQGESYNFNGISIVGFGNTHAEIYGDMGQVQNTGYMIDTLCYPGDAFHFPNTIVDVLVLPVAGPWMKPKEAIDYARKIHPRICFPVHDAIIAPQATFWWQLPEMILKEDNIGFKKLELGIEEDL